MAFKERLDKFIGGATNLYQAPVGMLTDIWAASRDGDGLSGDELKNIMSDRATQGIGGVKDLYETFPVINKGTLNKIPQITDFAEEAFNEAELMWNHQLQEEQQRNPRVFDLSNKVLGTDMQPGDVSMSKGLSVAGGGIGGAFNAITKGENPFSQEVWNASQMLQEAENTSMGQMVVNKTLGLADLPDAKRQEIENSWQYVMATGTIDGIGRWQFDPMIVGGKGAKKFGEKQGHFIGVEPFYGKIKKRVERSLGHKIKELDEIKGETRAWDAEMGPALKEGENMYLVMDADEAKSAGLWDDSSELTLRDSEGVVQNTSPIYARSQTLIEEARKNLPGDSPILEWGEGGEIYHYIDISKNTDVATKQSRELFDFFLESTGGPGAQKLRRVLNSEDSAMPNVNDLKNMYKKIDDNWNQYTQTSSAGKYYNARVTKAIEEVATKKGATAEQISGAKGKVGTFGRSNIYSGKFYELSPARAKEIITELFLRKLDEAYPGTSSFTSRAAAQTGQKIEAGEKGKIIFRDKGEALAAAKVDGAWRKSNQKSEASMGKFDMENPTVVVEINPEGLPVIIPRWDADAGFVLTDVNRIEKANIVKKTIHTINDLDFADVNYSPVQLTNQINNLSKSIMKELQGKLATGDDTLSAINAYKYADGSPYIHISLDLLPEFQKQGIANKYLDRIIDFADSRGIKIEADLANFDIWPWLERKGFKVSTKDKAIIYRDARKASATDLPLSFWSEKGTKSPRLFEDLDEARNANEKILRAYSESTSMSEQMMSNTIMKTEYGDTGLLNQLVNHKRIKTAVEIMAGKKSAGFTTAKGPMSASDIHKYFFKNTPDGDVIAAMLAKADGPEAKMEVLLAVMGLKMPKSINGVPGEMMNDLYYRNLEMQKLKDRIKATKKVTENNADAHVKMAEKIEDKLTLDRHVKQYKKETADGLEEISPSSLKSLQEIDDLIESKFPDRNMSTSVDEYMQMNPDEAERVLLDLEYQEALMRKADILADQNLKKAIDVATAEQMEGMLKHVPYASLGKKVQYAVRTSNFYKNSAITRPVRSIVEFQPRSWLNLSASDGHVQIERFLLDAKSKFGKELFSAKEITNYMDSFILKRRDVERFQLILKVTQDTIERIGKQQGLTKVEITNMVSEMQSGVSKTKNFIEARRYGPKSDKGVRNSLKNQSDEIMSKVDTEVGYYGDTIKYYDSTTGTYVEQVMPMMGTQLANWVPLTDLKLLKQEINKRSGLYRKLGTTRATQVLEGLGDSFYSVWKPSVLLRGGWPVRFVSDEQLRLLSRGVTLMDHVLSISKTTNTKNKIWDNQIRKAWNDGDYATALGASTGLLLSSSVRITTQGITLASKVGAKFIELIPGKKQKSVIMDNLGGELEPLVSARAGFATPSDNILSQYGSFLSKAETGNLGKYQKKAKTGQFGPIPKGQPGYSIGWLRALNYQIMGDPLGRRVIQQGVKAIEEARKVYPNMITTDNVLAIWQRNVHTEFKKFFSTEQGQAYANQMPWRGREYKGERWVEEWGDDILDMSAQYTMLSTAGPGNETYSLLKSLAEGRLSTTTLNKIPDQYRPPVIHGEEIAQVFGTDGVVRSLFKGFATEGFEGFGRIPTDILSRNPLMRALLTEEVIRRKNLLIKQGKKDFTASEIQQVVRQAKKGAIEETQRFMYNIAEQPRMASTMVRFMIPFLGANIEIGKVWSGLTRQNPTIPGKANLIWNSPNKAVNTPDGFFQGAGESGEYTLITKDEEGNEYLTFMLSESYLEDKDYYGWKKYLANSKYKFNKRSFNMVTQNPIGNGGPIMQLAVNEIAVRNPEVEATMIGEYILSWGVKGGTSLGVRILGGQAPSVKTLAEGFEFVDDFNGQKRRVINDTITYYDTQVRLGEADPASPEEIIGMGSKVWLLLAFIKYYSPASPIVESPLKPYIDAYRELVEELGANEGTQAFLKQYGEEYFAVTKGRTISKTGLPPTQEAEEARKPFKDLLVKNPEFARVIVGDTYDVGEWSSAVYAAQLSSTVDRNFKKEMLRIYGPEREYKNYVAKDFLPSGKIREVDEDLGWQKFGQLIDEVEGYRLEYGYKNLRVKEASGLKAWKDEQIAKLREEHPAWSDVYDIRDFSAFQDRLDVLESIVENVLDPAITNDPTTRPDLLGLMFYLDFRNQKKAELKERDFKTLTAQANYNFKEEFLAGVDLILAEYPEFVNIYYRYLEEDDLR